MPQASPVEEYRKGHSETEKIVVKINVISEFYRKLKGFGYKLKQKGLFC